MEGILGTEFLSTQHGTENSEIHYEDGEQSEKTKKRGKQNWRWLERFETKRMRREMNRFMLRRKISYCLSSPVVIYHVRGLSEAVAAQNQKTDEIHTWICPFLSSWNVKCKCGILGKEKLICKQRNTRPHRFKYLMIVTVK